MTNLANPQGVFSLNIPFIAYGAFRRFAGLDPRDAFKLFSGASNRLIVPSLLLTGFDSTIFLARPFSRQFILPGCVTDNDGKPANARTGTVSAVESIMGLCPDYDPDTGEPIMVPCVVGHRAAIAWDSPLPKDPIAVHWVILASASGDIITSGWLGGRNANAAGEATATTFTCPREFTSEDVGRTIVISWGWRRAIPLEFDHLNRRDFFTPDEGDTGGLAFPPTAAHPGYWTALPKSSAYSERDRWGFKVPSLRTFAEGDAARWTDDNFADPTTSSPVSNDVVSDYLRYIDRGWQGIPCYQSPVFRPSIKGTITSGTNFSFTDDAAQWWEVSGSTRPDGSIILHSGIGASGGSNTKVVVTSIADGFFGVTDYFVDQIIEVEVLSGVWEARPIKIQSADATKSFESYDTVPAFSHTTVGKNWRIRQAGYVRNRWIDRKVTFTKLDGTQISVIGKWNDNKTWFTTTQAFTFEAGWKYEIADHEPGDVWHYHSGGWHRPYDSGIAQDSRGQVWRKDPAWNLPHKYVVKGDDTGGRFRVADIVDLPLLRLLFVALNALVWSAKDVSYRGRRDPAIAEWNYRPFFTLIETSSEDACASEFARGDDQWQHETPPYVEESDGAPFAAYGIGLRIDLVGTIAAPRRYAYAVVSNLCDGMAKKVSIWGRTLIYSGSGPNGDQEQPFTGCDVLTGYAGKVGLFFHTHGDFVGTVALNNWGELASSGLETGAQVVKRVGNQTVDGTVAANWNALAAMPDKAPCPPYPRGDCSITGHPEEAWFGSDNIWGYRITASKAIVKWNVPGGLKFVDVVD